MSILDYGVIRRIRQHHAIEHATITLLMRAHPSLELLGGRSNHRGFYVYGEVDGSQLAAAVAEALARLQRGEAGLAIHPNCGTNLVTAGALAGLAAFTTSAIGRRQRVGLVDQIPAVMLASTAGMLLGRQAGMRLQARVTTLADVRGLAVGSITRKQFRRWIQHFVTIERAAGQPAPAGQLG